MVEVITLERFKNEIFDFTIDEEWKLQPKDRIILNFFATWCGPCHNFAPVLQEIGDAYQNAIKVYKVDIDASPEIPHLFGIKSVPTTVFLAYGEEPALVSGGMSFDSMQLAIRDLLSVDLT